MTQQFFVSKKKSPTEESIEREKVFDIRKH